MTRRVLSLDGGGIKGVFAASFLASVEESLGRPISSFFDLIVGTSTGGIIALGLGLGLSARDILSFYEQHGPTIFGGNIWLRRLRRLFRAKYNPSALKNALQAVFGERRLGDSTRRLVVPAFNIETGEVHIWKTAHHPRLERDYRCTAVEVGLSTAAAPTYFPTHLCQSGVPLIDGGVWANNPIAIAAVEAIGVLGWAPESLRVLSVGCTGTPLDVDWGRRHSLGMANWALRITDVFMAAQSVAALGMAQHLVPDRKAVVRICPTVGRGRFGLDGTSDIPSLRGIGDFEARKALPQLRGIFFHEPAEKFVPDYFLRKDLEPSRVPTTEQPRGDHQDRRVCSDQRNGA